jgi:hypothetical protein
MQTPPKKLRAGLMDPDNPQPVPRPSGGMTLTTVQMWVASVLAVSTLLHFAAGLVLAAYVADEHSARVGLLVIAGLMGVFAVGAGLLIHQQRLLSAWLLFGLVPSLVGAYLMFWR